MMCISAAADDRQEAKAVTAYKEKMPSGALFILLQM